MEAASRLFVGLAFLRKRFTGMAEAVHSTVRVERGALILHLLEEDGAWDAGSIIYVRNAMPWWQFSSNS
jgi:hypothetical protein